MCFAELLNPFLEGTASHCLLGEAGMARRMGRQFGVNFYLRPHSMLTLHDFLYNLMGRFLLL